MVRSASRPGEPEIIHNLNHSQKKLNPHKYLWAFHTEKQVGQISEYFTVEKFGLLWKAKIKQSRGRGDQFPAALGQCGGAFIKMANRPEIPDLYPFKSHLLALQPLSLLFHQDKITFTKMVLETSIMIKLFLLPMIYQNVKLCLAWARLHAALKPYQHDIRRHELTHENYIC